MGWTLKPIKFIQDRRISDGSSNFLLVSSVVGPLRLRAINAVNYTTVGRVTIEVVNASTRDSVSSPSLSLVHKEYQRELEADVGWEGDIVITADQKVRANFELSNNLDVVFITVGYEDI